VSHNNTNISIKISQTHLDVFILSTGDELVLFEEAPIQACHFSHMRGDPWQGFVFLWVQTVSKQIE